VLPKNPGTKSKTAVEATGVGVGTFLVGLSRFLPGHPTAQAFLIFIAPFSAVIVNTYVRGAFDQYQKTRKFNLLLHELEEQIADPRTNAERRSKLEALREKLMDTRLRDQLENAELDPGIANPLL
jgi:hypothetical protein